MVKHGVLQNLRYLKQIKAFNNNILQKNSNVIQPSRKKSKHIYEQILTGMSKKMRKAIFNNMRIKSRHNKWGLGRIISFLRKVA